MISVDERPLNFDEVKGQRFLINNLRNQSKRGSFFQVMIFCGMYGTGKTTVARVVGRASNCENVDEHGNPCLVCPSCKASLNNMNTDIIEIDGASNNGVDAARKLKEEVSYMPQGKKKVYIIDECHQITKQAWQSLLKILEEPPAHVMFILCTTDLMAVPDTIRSRAMIYEFLALPAEILCEKMREVAGKYDINISDSAISLIASYADGSMRNALSLIEQISMQCDCITEETVEQLLGINHYTCTISFIKELLAGNLNACLRIMQEVVATGKSVRLFVKDINKAAVDMVLRKNDICCFNPNQEYQSVLDSIVNNCSVKRLNDLITVLTDMSSKIGYDADSYDLFGGIVACHRTLNVKVDNHIVKDEVLQECSNAGNSKTEKTAGMEQSLDAIAEEMSMHMESENQVLNKMEVTDEQECGRVSNDKEQDEFLACGMLFNNFIPLDFGEISHNGNTDVLETEDKSSDDSKCKSIKDSVTESLGENVTELMENQGGDDSEYIDFNEMSESDMKIETLFSTVMEPAQKSGILPLPKHTDERLGIEGDTKNAISDVEGTGINFFGLPLNKVGTSVGMKNSFKQGLVHSVNEEVSDNDWMKLPLDMYEAEPKKNNVIELLNRVVGKARESVNKAFGEGRISTEDIEEALNDSCEIGLEDEKLSPIQAAANRELQRLQDSNPSVQPALLQCALSYTDKGLLISCSLWPIYKVMQAVTEGARYLKVVYEPSV